KLKAPESGDTLPALSVCRTVTLLAPSPASVKLVPLPAVQFAPPSMLYCQVAPASSPLTFTVPLLVIWSLLELPLSVASARLGALGAVASRVIAAPLADAVLPAPSVTVSCELTGPSSRPDRSATPAAALTVTLWVPSLNVTVALVTSGSMPDAVNATAPFSAALIVVSPIDSARSAPPSAVVSRVIAAPLADAVLPAPSITVSCELTGPSSRPDRSATPAAALTVTLWTPSLNVTVALVTSGSMPDVVNATAPFSAALIVVSPIDSARSAPPSAVVSRVIAAPLADAVLPAPSVTVSCELTGPSSRPDRSATPAAALTVTLWTPSLNVTVAL